MTIISDGQLGVDTRYEDDCDFCIEFSGGSNDFFTTASKAPPRARLIKTFSRLILFPCLGQIMEGHLLLAPTYHSTSMLRLRSEDDESLHRVVDIIVDAFLRHYKEPPLFFEHGDPTGGVEVSGQCIAHAHLHILPRQFDLTSEVAGNHRYLGQARLGEPFKVDVPYFMVSDPEGWFDVFDASEAPRQYLRQVYARLAGVPERGLWYENIDVGETLESAAQHRLLFGSEPQE